MERVVDGYGKEVCILIEPADRIEKIAAYTHMTAWELCQAIEEIINDGEGGE